MSDAPPAAPPWWKDRILWGLVGLGVVARVAAVAGSPLLNADGFFYLDTAARLQAGDWEHAFVWRVHPLYPLLVAGAGFAIPSPWAAGVIVSLVGALAAMAFLYRLVLEGWGEAAARATVFLYALHPHFAEMESDVMTEGVYHALAFGAVFLLHRGLRTAAWRPFLGAGALTGAAYLTRLEGLILAGTGFVAAAAFVSRPPFRPAWKGLGLAAGAAIVVALPFLLALRAAHGRWLWSPRPAADMVTEPAREPIREWEAESWRRFGRGPGAAINVAYQAQKVYYLVPLAFAGLAGVAFRRGAGGGSTGAILAALGGMGLAAVAAYHFHSAHPVSVRYVSTATALMLPWAGWGLAASVSRLRALRHGPLWAWTLLIAAGTALAAPIPSFPDERKQAFREAADWLRENGGRGKVLVTDHGGVAYHAAASLIKDHRIWDRLPALARAGKVDFLVLSDREVSRVPPERWKAVQDLPGFAEVRRFGERRHPVAVYTVRASP